jgi:hypothetical protein
MPMHKDKILQLAKVRPSGAALNACLKAYLEDSRDASRPAEGLCC